MITTVDEARIEGRRRWHTTRFDVVEIDDEQYAEDNRLYEAVGYVT